MKRPETAARIVVGVDGSPESRRALAFAVDEAERRGVDLHVVSTIEPFPTWIEAYGASMPPIDQRLAGMRRVAERAVAEVLGDRTDPPTVHVEVVESFPAQVLTDRSRDADMLVVGSRGHGGLAGMLLGSVSMQCALHAHCPVTIVRPPMHERAVDAAKVRHPARSERIVAPTY
jgi:nucleotide-binding universal stress UspA family protein